MTICLALLAFPHGLNQLLVAASSIGGESLSSLTPS
jgi:hypothetical protein